MAKLTKPQIYQLIKQRCEQLSGQTDLRPYQISDISKEHGFNLSRSALYRMKNNSDKGTGIWIKTAEKLAPFLGIKQEEFLIATSNLIPVLEKKYGAGREKPELPARYCDKFPNAAAVQFITGNPNAKPTGLGYIQ